MSRLAVSSSLLKRLEGGEPLPYVVGHHEFFGLDFDLTPDVLIPRPETELLVQKALDWMDRAPDRRTAADVGTGSGCIAISIATRFPDAQLLATDISLAALNVARSNARKFGVADRIHLVECDILPPHGRALTSEQTPGPGLREPSLHSKCEVAVFASLRAGTQPCARWRQGRT